MRGVDYGFCEAGDCHEPATNITEEGYRWCQEHAEGFYGIVHAMLGLPIPTPVDRSALRAMPEAP